MALSKTAFELLKILSDGAFHSGETLGQTLNMTRSAIWKALQQLKRYDIQIESITGKGYRLDPPLELLDLEKIKASTTPQTQAALDDILIFTELTSTNDYLLNIAKEPAKQKLACLVEHQTQGRGRRARSWSSAFGTNIYLSLLWHFNKDPSEIAGLSLAVAVAVNNALKTYGITDGISLKWPNDVLWKDQKLTGILLEMIAESHEQCSVVIGLGLNTHMPKEMATSITQPFTDIRSITGQPAERNHLIGLVLNELVQCTQDFQEHGLAPFLKSWHKSAALIGEPVVLHTPQGNIEGIMKGVSERGEVILINHEQKELRFFSGEVSLRKKPK